MSNSQSKLNERSSGRSKHVMVVSHMRSGTHLMMDLIGNNLADYADTYRALGPLEVDVLTRANPRPLTEMDAQLDAGARIIKTHAHLPILDFFWERPEVAEWFEALLSRSYVVYMTRHPLDVLWSAFHYERVWNDDARGISFTEYIHGRNRLHSQGNAGSLSRAEYLSEHLAGWLRRVDVTVFCFEAIARSPKQVVQRLVSLCECQMPNSIRSPYHTGFELGLLRLRTVPGLRWVTDRVRWRLFPDVHATSVCFRKGRLRDGVRNVSHEDAQYVEHCLADCGVMLKRDGGVRIVASSVSAEDVN